MTYTSISKGTEDWDVPVNAAFTDIDTRVTANAVNITTNSSNISTHTSQITALQGNTANATTAQGFGLLGWTHDPVSVSTGNLATNGTLHLSRINVGVTGTATKLYWGINAAGATPTAGQNFISLWDSTGARLANVGVDARVTTTGLFTETISASLTPGFYWVGFLFNAATAPSVYRSQSLNATLMNTGLSASQARFCTNGTGLTVSPASITPGSNSVSALTFYAALGL